ncbi:hypothetical protein ACJX0J_021840, partial [Zea mays]
LHVPLQFGEQPNYISRRSIIQGFVTSGDEHRLAKMQAINNAGFLDPKTILNTKKSSTDIFLGTLGNLLMQAFLANLAIPFFLYFVSLEKQSLDQFQSSHTRAIMEENI